MSDKLINEVNKINNTGIIDEKSVIWNEIKSDSLDKTFLENLGIDK